MTVFPSEPLLFQQMGKSYPEAETGFMRNKKKAVTYAELSWLMRKWRL
jgi:hypothetical protein